MLHLLPLLTPGAAQAQEFGLTVNPRVEVDLARNRAAEDSVAAYTWLRLWASGQEDELRWFVEARALSRVLVGEDVESVIGPSLGEAGVEVPIGPTWLRAGHLIERWGRLDLLSVADPLSGRDLRVGPQIPGEFARLPAPMVRLQAPWSWGQAEVVWVPVPSTDRASPLGTDWSLIRQGMLEGVLADAATWEGDALTEETLQSAITALGEGVGQLDPWTRSSLSELQGVSGLPAAFGPGGDLAARVAVRSRIVDAALQGGVVRSRQVAPVLDPALVAYIREERLPTYAEQEALLEALAEPAQLLAPRAPMAGVELERLLGSVGVRAEGAWRGAVVVPERWLSAAESPEVSAGLGLDYLWGSWVLAAEGSWRRLLDAPEDPFLVAPQWWQVGGGVQGRLARERLSVQVGGLYDISFGEFLLRPGASWRASDAVELGCEVLLIGGARAAPQTFRQAMEFTGGPLGYWGDNDAVTLSARWIR